MFSKLRPAEELNLTSRLKVGHSIHLELTGHNGGLPRPYSYKGGLRFPFLSQILRFLRYYEPSAVLFVLKKRLLLQTCPNTSRSKKNEPVRHFRLALNRYYLSCRKMARSFPAYGGPRSLTSPNYLAV